MTLLLDDVQFNRIDDAALGIGQTVELVGPTLPFAENGEQVIEW